MTVIRITLIKHCPKLVTHSLRGPRVHSRKVTQSLRHLASLGLFHLDVLPLLVLVMWPLWTNHNPGRRAP